MKWVNYSSKIMTVWITAVVKLRMGSCSCSGQIDALVIKKNNGCK